MIDTLTSWPCTAAAVILAIIGIQMARRRLEERQRAEDLRLTLALIRRVRCSMTGEEADDD
jgi:hypothetical protein